MLLHLGLSRLVDIGSTFSSSLSSEYLGSDDVTGDLLWRGISLDLGLLVFGLVLEGG